MVHKSGCAHPLSSTFIGKAQKYNGESRNNQRKILNKLVILNIFNYQIILLICLLKLFTMIQLTKIYTFIRNHSQIKKVFHIQLFQLFLY